MRAPVILSLVATALALPAVAGPAAEELPGSAVGFEADAPGKLPVLPWNRMGAYAAPTEWSVVEGQAAEGARFARCTTGQELALGWEAPAGCVTGVVRLRADRDGTPCVLRLSSYDRLRRQDTTREVIAGTAWTEFRIERDVLGGPVELALRGASPGTALSADALRLLAAAPPPNPMASEARVQPLRLDHAALQADPAGRDGRSGSVDLTLSRPPGADPPLPFASGGIPFPRGALFSRSQVRLRDDAGREVPLQADVLARWNADRSIKALLLTFPIEPSRGAEQRYRLEYGPECRPSAPRARLSIARSAGRVEVDTGAARVTFDRKGLLEASAGGRAVLSAGRGSLFLDGSGAAHAAAPGEVTVEREGPLAVTATLRGEHRREGAPPGEAGRLGRFTLRITAFAGSTTLHVAHTLFQDGPDLVTAIRGAGLELGLPSQRGAREPAEEVILDPWTSGGARGEGVIDLPGTPRIRIRDAWQNHPKAVSVAANRLTLWCWPPQAGRSVCWSQGLSRTTEFLLDLAPTGEGVPYTTVAEPLLSAPAQWYCDSGAFGFLLPPAPERFPIFEATVGKLKTLGGFSAAGKESSRLFGLFNYGDAPGDGGWSNLETMADHELLLHFFRTLDREHFDMARLAAEHYRDVDIHHGLGFCHTHCPNHTSSDEGWSHSWIQGQRDLYFLKGDLGCLDAMLTVGTRASRKAHGDESGRDFTLLINNLVDLYGATGLPDVLRSARGQIETLASRQEPASSICGAEKGSWYEDRYAAGSAFTWYGCLALAKLHQDTGDARVAEVLKRELDLSLDVATKGRRAGVFLPSDPVSDEKRAEVIGTFALGRGCVLFPPLGYLYRLTGDRGYLRLGMDVLAFCLLNQRGGSDASATSFMTAFLREAREAGLGPREEREAFERARGFSWAQWPKELVNSGFEEPEFRGWQGIRRQPGAVEFVDELVRITYRQDGAVARSGKRSLCIHSENPRRTVTVTGQCALEPATEYEAEVWIRSGGTQSAGASVSLREYDTGFAAGVVLRPAGKPVNGWQKHSGRFLSRGRTVAGLQLTARNGLDDVWFDDACIRKLGPTYRLLTGNGGAGGPYAGLLEEVSGHYEPSTPMAGERAGNTARVPFNEGCLTDGLPEYDYRRKPNPSYAYWDHKPGGEIALCFERMVTVRRVRVHLLNKAPHGTSAISLLDADGREVGRIPEPLDGWNTLPDLDLTTDRLLLRFTAAPGTSYVTLSEIEVWGEPARQ